METTNSLDEYAQEVLDGLTTASENPESSKILDAMIEAKLSSKNKPDILNSEIFELAKGEGLVDLIDKISAKIIESLPVKIQHEIEKTTRVICVRTSDVFGFFSQQAETGYCVIAISTGFMMLLNKLTKFDFAKHDISKVIYCNRYKIEELDAKKIDEMQSIVIEQYKKNDVRGPIIALDEDGTRLVQVITQEAFIVAHELGHYIDKIICDEAFTKLMYEFTADPIKNDAHASEFAADALGLYLLMSSYVLEDIIVYNQPTLRIMDDDWRKTRVNIFCTSVCHFFDYLSLAGQDESETHPHSQRRIENALWWIFGENVAQAYFKWMRGDTYPNWGELEITQTGFLAFKAILENALSEENLNEHFKNPQVPIS